VTAYDYDIVLLSDLRYPGGNSASLAEEIKAQARTGYSTGLVHLPAPHMARRRSFNRKVMDCLASGLAELVPASREVRARALVIRQPRLFTEDLPEPLRIRADEKVLVVNQPPVDRLRGPDDPYYDVAEVRDRVTALLGEVPWAPIGPLVRHALDKSGVQLNLRDDDWVNILDVDEWRTVRRPIGDRQPVIGRHSRGHESKWPSVRSDILGAYPADDGIDVRILGGADPAIRVLGYQPENWTVYPFGSLPPQRFLREIDFFVYYHHPGWVEAFGRNIIEGMASGCPAILPPHFNRVFGASCTYAQPREVRTVIEMLHGDPGEYQSRSERAVAHVEESFGTHQHARRIKDLIGEPSSSSPARYRPKPRARRTLLASLEPRGAGSVSRLLRVAEGLEGDIDPILLAPWPAIQLGHAAGVLCDVLPDHHLEGLDPKPSVERLLAAARDHRAEAIVLDVQRSTAASVLAARSGAIPWILSGPASPWRRHTCHNGSSESVEWDDVALGSVHDPASPSVPGVGDPLPAEAARAALGLASGRPLALLCPGADGRLVAVPRLGLIARALVAHGWSVAFTEPLRPPEGLHLPNSVIRISPRPLWRYLRAFDIAVAAPGYTLTHELVAAGCSALLVPFDDDPAKAARAVGASERGLALRLDEFSERALGSALEELGDAAVRSRLSRTCADVGLCGGAPRILEALEHASVQKTREIRVRAGQDG
jgi:hypothetical protein